MYDSPFPSIRYTPQLLKSFSAGADKYIKPGAPVSHTKEMGTNRPWPTSNEILYTQKVVGIDFNAPHDQSRVCESWAVIYEFRLDWRVSDLEIIWVSHVYVVLWEISVSKKDTVEHLIILVHKKMGGGARRRRRSGCEALHTCCAG